MANNQVNAEKQSEKLAARFATKAQKGLLDVKFYIRNHMETSAEQVCGEINAIYDAIERGEVSDIDLEDSHK